MQKTIIFIAILLTAVAVSWGEECPPAVSAFLEQHCFDCHNDVVAKGELDLANLGFHLDDAANRERWILIYDRIAKQEMPPESDELPRAERAELLKTLRRPLADADRAEISALGHAPMRRLTQTEYEDNLRDLLALPNLDVADLLPEDRSVDGFKKVASLLEISRVQLAGYLDASGVALSEAVASGVKPPKTRKWRFTGTDLFSAPTTYGGREAMFFTKNGRWNANPKSQEKAANENDDSPLELALFRSAAWPYYGYPRGFLAALSGEYRVRFSARAVRQLPGFRIVPAHDPLPMSFRARQPSGPDVSGDVSETGGWIDLMPKAKVFETTIQLNTGETFEYSLLGLPVPFIRTDGGFYYDFPPMPPEGHRGAAIQWLEVEGPLTPESWPPESHRVLFGDLPIAPATEQNGIPVRVVSRQPKQDAERLLRRFVERAARRPLPEDSLDVYLKLIRDDLNTGTPFAEAMLKGYQALLCSGHFLFLREPTKGDTLALASRLSHLLWNSRPDEALYQTAQDGLLAKTSVLKAETDRLIADRRFDRFVENFTDQWLSLSDLRRDIPDRRLYYLVDSMERETRAFLRAMIRDNLPASVLVDADFAFLNDRLAAHYGLPREAGSAMRRVKLPDWSPYGGLLTQASIMKLTSNGTTTSPVLRGVWVMKKLMGDPPPAPPKSVPAIQPDIRGATTIRETLAKHTESESCAACHARFDPVGFALENFDVMGAWRDRYRGLERGEKITGIDPGGHPFTYFIGPQVDSAGTLRSGEMFSDVIELKRILKADPRPLARNLLHQFVFYATGSHVRFSERSDIESILDDCEANGYRVGDLLRATISSDLFAGIQRPSLVEKKSK